MVEESLLSAEKLRRGVNRTSSKTLGVAMGVSSAMTVAKILRLLLAAIGCILTISVVLADEPKDPGPVRVLQCFWIYAPILEVGREMNRADLTYFAQKRIGWVMGYMTACKSYSQCKQELDRGFQNLETSKQQALARKARLIKAIQERNRDMFAANLNEALTCDGTFGINTADVPAL